MPTGCAQNVLTLSACICVHLRLNFFLPSAQCERTFATDTPHTPMRSFTTVRSISEQIQLVIIHDVRRTVGCLKNHRFYRGFFKYCNRKHLHQCVE